MTALFGPKGRLPQALIIILGSTLLFIGVSIPLCTPSAVVSTAWQQAAGVPAPAAAPSAWHSVTTCKIYILDLSAEVAAAAGIPQCDIHDPEVWPLNEPGELGWSLQRMEVMPHMHYQYAGLWWLTESLRNATAVLTDDIEEACLVWVDSYCYNQWFIIQRAVALRDLEGYPRSKVDVRATYRKALDHVTSSPRFQRHQGRDYVFHLPMRDTEPGGAFTNLCSTMLLSHTLVAEHSSSCRAKRQKVPLRETQILPYCTVAEVDLSVPVVGSSRPTLLYMQASCNKNEQKNCGKLMRYRLAQAFNNSDPDVEVKCANKPVMQPKSYTEVQREMRQSTFCLLPPGDTSSSNRLTEVILAGCIPVFIGHPWHEMPFNHGEVDWPSMSVFLNITNASWLGTAACVTQLQYWQQMADVGWATTAVPDMQAALAYLRAMPNEVVQRRQAALERERPKLFYGRAPGSTTSALADIVFTNLLDYGHRLAAGELSVTMR